MGDDRLVFDAQSNQGERVLAVIPLGTDKISAAGTAAVLLNGGHWGTYFANGERDLDTATDELLDADVLGLSVFPSPFQANLEVNISTEYASAIQQIRLFDILGRELICVAGRSGAEHYTLATEKLPLGAYFLQINLQEGRVVRKVLKQ